MYASVFSVRRRRFFVEGETYEENSRHIGRAR